MSLFRHVSKCKRHLQGTVKREDFFVAYCNYMTLLGNVVYVRVFYCVACFLCVLFLVLRDYFRIFVDNVVVKWALDLFTKVMYVGFLYGICMFSFFRAFGLSIIFAIAPRVCFVSSLFWAYVYLVFLYNLCFH